MIETGFEAQGSLLKGVNILANIVKTTLGPKGKTVILHTPEGKAYTTKDGVSVARKVFDNDMMVDAGIQLVREATAKTAEEAGDGTTTSTVLAQSLINQCISRIQSEAISTQTLIEEMSEALERVLQELSSEEYSTKIELDKKTLTDIATISANNDKALGEVIAEAFLEVGRDGLVLFDQASNDKTTVENISGMQLQSQLISPAFITNQRSQTAEYTEKTSPIAVLLINNVVKNIQEMAQTTLNYAIQKGAPILLVAQDFSPAVIKDIIQNNIRNNTQILPIKAEGFGNGKIECLKDIAAITGATIFDNTALANHSGFGACQKVIVSRTSTTIIKSDKVDDSALMERAEMLKERIQAENSAYDKKQLQEKLAKLIGKMAIIHVGGITETIAKERYDRVEDAVYAVRAAIEEGISVGGGMTYYRISNALAPSNISVGWEILMTALKAPIETLCLNTTGTLTLLEDFEKQHTTSVAVGIDFATKEIVNMKQVGIIDPTKVLRVALENAVAVTGTIINTSGIITGE